MNVITYSWLVQTYWILSCPDGTMFIMKFVDVNDYEPYTKPQGASICG